VSEVRLTLGWVANAAHGHVVSGNPAREVGNITTDTRTLQHGDCFVALKGPRFDGHEFVVGAFEKGATAAIVERGTDVGAGLHAGAGRHVGAGLHAGAGRHVGAGLKAGPYKDRGLIEVADTLKALQDVAHAVRRDAGTKVIAITGSAGKTTTKETIAEFLSTRFRVVKNKGNLNNHIGLPLSLMQLRTAPDVAVMELGMNHAGEISTLVAIAEPDVRVWTNVGDAHLGFFASPEAIADAKSEILERANPDDVLVANADDPLVVARTGGFAGRTITFGTSEEATVRASEVEDLGIAGMRARVRTPAGERIIRTPLLGRGNLSNVLAGIAVALDAGIDLDEIVAAAAQLQPADRRGAVRHLARGVTLIDDSYNSSPTALRRALEVVANERGVTRKVAVLGEMLELGEHATGLHEDSGRAAAAAGLARLFTVGGPPARAMADAAVAAGMPPAAVTYFEKSDSAAPEIAAAVGPGDLVLVKGSRGTRTDIVADRIAAEFA
jgi:UDP-N-acetylmuramoyl-tripeptide--D-alanyl-D-alanine ligase